MRFHLEHRSNNMQAGGSSRQRVKIRSRVGHGQIKGLVKWLELLHPSQSLLEPFCYEMRGGTHLQLRRIEPNFRKQVDIQNVFVFQNYCARTRSMRCIAGGTQSRCARTKAARARIALLHTPTAVSGAGGENKSGYRQLIYVNTRYDRSGGSVDLRTHAHSYRF